MTIVVIMPTLAISNYALQVDGIEKGKAYLDIVRCVDRVDGNLGLIRSAIEGITVPVAVRTPHLFGVLETVRQIDGKLSLS
jgi:hypothetical protein